MKTIERTEYLNRIKDLKDTPYIKVITGIRKSGKLILMQKYETIKEEADRKLAQINADIEKTLVYHY